MVRAGLIAALLFAPAAAFAQAAPMAMAPPACTGAPAPLPPELASWRERVPVAAAGSVARVAHATLTIGTSAEAALLSTGAVAYPAAPGKAGAAASHGGLLAFTVARAGTYRVALGSAAWIDVVQGSTVVPSSAHGHGPACSGIRKTVDFTLGPGRYLLQIAGSDAPAIAVLVARSPS